MASKKNSNKQVTNYVSGLVDTTKSLLDDLTSTAGDPTYLLHCMVAALALPL